MDKMYTLQELSKSTFIPFSEEMVQFNTLDVSSIIKDPNELFLNFYKQFAFVSIPKSYFDWIEKLLTEYNIKCQDKFVTLLCSFQFVYLPHMDKQLDIPLVKDFNEEHNEWELFFNVLEEYLIKDNFDYKNISFQFESKKKHSINNYWVNKDIYEAIAVGFGITKDNFFERKKEILNDTLKLNLNKSDKYILSILVQTLSSLWSIEGKIQNIHLRFIGFFLNLAGVKVSNDNQPIEIFDSLEDNLKHVEVKNVRHYYNGRTKYFHK
ncbi:hypothetical protein [Maribacter stanieri]|uniref:hypothetical protein n=1 Tax=Maribacter stanieri TaxID=440514 RepID=UPI0024950273|nr:hypothetical protein [Maribacter stanieri]